MIIGTDSMEMKYILLKFLMDSLDFLADDLSAKGTKRSDWANTWISLNLSEEAIDKWMPKDDN